MKIGYMMKGWQDHPLTGMFTFFGIGAGVVIFLFTQIIIPQKIDGLKEENSRLSTANSNKHQQITNLKNKLEEKELIVKNNCAKVQSTLASSQEIIKNNQVIYLEEKVNKLNDELNVCSQSKSKNNNTNFTNDHSAKIKNIEYVGSYGFEMTGCFNESRKIKCNFTILIEDGGVAYFHRKSFKGSSLIYLSNGDVKSAYKLNIGDVGGTKESFGVRLPPDVPIKGSLEFRGVNSNKIKLLEIAIARNILDKPKYARFKNIVVMSN